jgi:hypothetical protein
MGEILLLSSKSEIANNYHAVSEMFFFESVIIIISLLTGVLLSVWFKGSLKERFMSSTKMTFLISIFVFLIGYNYLLVLTLILS